MYVYIYRSIDIHLYIHDYVLVLHACIHTYIHTYIHISYMPSLETLYISRPTLQGAAAVPAGPESLSLGAEPSGGRYLGAPHAPETVAGP